ncbi:MAG TPA: CRTAC1 family protein [Planctomycetota bacterium]
MNRALRFALGLPLAGLFVVPTAAGQASATFVDESERLGLQLGDDRAAWGDFDGDGWVDLLAAGTLWRNEAGRRFVKVASEGPGVFGDFDDDGDLDLFLFDGRVLRNDGEDGFAAVPMPELEPSVCLGACWGDFNGDGLLDVYAGGYEDWDKGIDYPDRLFLNEGGRAFALGWSEARYRARGVTACDFDRDGDLDVYVSNYRLQPNLLWRNDGSGKFTDVTASHGAVATSPGFAGGHSIGAAWGDFDDDGEFDLFAGNFAHVDDRGDQPKSRFLRNRGPGDDFAFEDRGACGIPYQESYASPAAADYDNDGDLDLYFTTVYGTASFGVANHPVLQRNDGDWNWTEVAAAEGLGRLPPTYQAAWADFDHDGDLDLVTAGRLFVNQGNRNHWLEVRLVGVPGHNRSAVGAQVRVHLAGRTLARQVEAGTGQGNQNDATLHFGLGAEAGPLRLTVQWPDGSTQTLNEVAADRILALRRAAPSAAEPRQK